jgi:chromosome partitioning protein
MTHIYSIANQKGGVGKTTTAINLGVALADMKKKTLLIDLDPQGALSVGMGLKVRQADTTAYDILMNEETAPDQAIYSIEPFLDVIPADNDLAAAEIELIPEIRRELVLRRVIAPLKNFYSFILIDCPPSLNLLTVNAFCASDGVILPVQCEYFSIRVIETILDSINRTKERLNPDLALTGILPTMYATGTVHAREVLEQLHELYGDKVFKTVIYNSIRFAEASVAHKALIHYDSGHKGAKAYVELAQTLLNGAA